MLVGEKMVAILGSNLRQMMLYPPWNDHISLDSQSMMIFPLDAVWWEIRLFRGM